ncbi:GGDEF domain-containing protein [Hoeflea sp. YIM 152468]|uniref:GGDEF domain-containing protein n=1 Tax=Hoeflea sp. YIM 152468 TaxID=3031759 RepID=UPI0023DCA431|nr:GGDEF domain-containing protein [Hoeflea sp. YIM 152468]MDF1609556.1 GGDEF domain-containing protein [Hoeflea sp. YIM 152468]
MQTDHRALSGRIYNESLKTAMTDRAMVPDRLLTPDSRLLDASPALGALYESYCWAAHSLKARAWLQAAFVFNFLLMSFDYFVSPSLLIATLLIRGCIMSTILLGLYLLWGRQRPRWLQGATLVAVSATMMIGSGALGALGGVLLFERYLTGALFTVATAILFFPIEFRWTAAAVVAAIILHAGMIVTGPVADPLVALSTSCFYSSVIITFASTRKAALRSQWKSFKSKIRELRDQEALASLNAELQLIANLDPLTGLQNRRSSQEDIERIWSDASFAKPAIAFLMLDIDNFKQLNDSLGHAAGDDCIKGVGNKISLALGDGDIVSRYGGEEFLVVLTGTTASDALAVAERIRRSVETFPLKTSEDESASQVTISIGLALWQGDQTPQTLIKRADAALYEAKRRGKNQTVIAPPPPGIGAHTGQGQGKKIA